MTFYDRYINGETEAVYDEILKMGDHAFLPQNLTDIEKVLTEIFHRVAFNLDIIYSELKKIDYIFRKDKKGNDTAIVKPTADTDELLKALEKATQPFGYLPLSLKMFYKIVGACDFVWDYEQDENIIWEMSDAIQITPLRHCVEQVTDEYWLEEAQVQLEDEEFGYASLILAADDLCKDNISGGPPYTLQLTPRPSIDSIFLDANRATFINYLRKCFDDCGFPGIPEIEDSFTNFYDNVKPQLKKI